MDDVLKFAPESSGTPEGLLSPPWKILIADDEPTVHLVTKLALGDFRFGGRQLELLSAYSESDTRKALAEHPDIALVLLDVVMDTMTSGFDMVRHIREDLKNKDIRIVLRTGQSGNDPEDRVIIDYDINDFKDKTELTVAKLRTTLIGSLRTYSHLKIIEGERRKAASHRTYLRSIINTLSSVVVTLNRQMQVVLWNQQAEAFTGISEARAVGKSFFEVSPLLAPFQPLVEQVLDGGSPVERSGVPLPLQPVRFVHLSIQRLADAVGPEVLLRLDDRTEAKHQDDQLVQSQKLSTFSALASGLVTEIDHLVDELNREAQTLPGLQSAEAVRRLGRKAHSLIQPLARFSLSKERETVALDLSALVTRKIAHWRQLPGFRIDWSAPTENSAFRGNLEDWDLVLDSLISNSVDAMTWMPGAADLPGERVLKVQLLYRGLDSPVRQARPELEGTPYWELRFTDNGIGMGQEVAAQALDPYFSTKPAGRGVGLGLPLTFSVVELCGGVLELHSQPGVGTEATLLLPIHGAPPTGNWVNRGLVMVCDDEVLMRQVTSKLLRKMGYRTVEAADAVTALEQYRLHAQELVLVVLDVLLPGRSGFEVFRDLHEFDPDLPVLLSSGFGKGEQVSRALKEGLAGFLQKPFGYEGLRGAVEAALSGNNPDFPIR